MAATVAGYVVAHVSATFTTRGLVGMLTICAAALVGFLDDWLKVTRQRSLGPQQTGQDRRPVRGGRRLCHRRRRVAEGGHPSFVYPFQLARAATRESGVGRFSLSW